jgi:hypothetical protein
MSGPRRGGVFSPCTSSFPSSVPILPGPCVLLMGADGERSRMWEGPAEQDGEWTPFPSLHFPDHLHHLQTRQIRPPLDLLSGLRDVAQ